MVAAGCGDLQRATGDRLADHVAQVGTLGIHRRIIGGDEAAQPVLAAQVGADLEQAVRRQHVDRAGQTCLVGIGPRQDHPAAVATGTERRGQRAVYAAQLASQGQLADELQSGDSIGRHLAAGDQDAQRDRQVKARAVLGQVGRCQVDRDAPLRHLELGAEQGRPHAVLGLAHRGLGQADDRHPRQAAGQMHLDLDRRRLHAALGAAVDEGDGHVRGRSNPWPRGEAPGSSRIRPSRRARRAPAALLRFPEPGAPAARASRGCAAARRAARRNPRG